MRAYVLLRGRAFFIFYVRKNCEWCKNRREEQLTRDYRKPESIRLYPAFSLRFLIVPAYLVGILRSFSISRQIGFHSFPLELICRYIRFTLFLLDIIQES